MTWNIFHNVFYFISDGIASSVPVQWIRVEKDWKWDSFPKWFFCQFVEMWSLPHFVRCDFGNILTGNLSPFHTLPNQKAPIVIHVNRHMRHYPFPTVPICTVSNAHLSTSARHYNRLSHVIARHACSFGPILRPPLDGIDSRSLTSLNPVQKKGRPTTFKTRYFVSNPCQLFPSPFPVPDSSGHILPNSLLRPVPSHARHC